MRKRVFSFFISSLILIFFLYGFQRQEKLFPPQKHEVTVRLILVDVIVLDKDGDFITDLKRDDFELFEDGLKVPLNSMELISLEKGEFIAPEKKEPIRPTPTPREKRLFVIFDSINTIRRELRQNKPKIIEKLMSLIQLGHEIMVLELTHREAMRVLQPFTQDEGLLAKAVRKASGSIWVEKSAEEKGQAPVIEDEAGPGQAQVKRGQAEKLSEMEEISYFYFFRVRFEKTVNGLLAFMNMIKDYPGRKTILFISSGIPYEDPRSFSNAVRIFDPFNLLDKPGIRKMHEVLDALIQFANAHNISFYALDPDTYIKYLSSHPDFAGGNVLFDSKDMLRAREKLDNLHNLNWLAQGTGGVSLKGAKRFENFYQAVKKDLSYYYELSFYPTKDEADGKYHKIEVKVNRPRVELRFRKGYTDYSEDQKQTLLFASASYNPSLFKQIPFEAQIVPFAQSEGKFILWMNFALPVKRFIVDNIEKIPSKALKLNLWVRDPSFENAFTGQISIPFIVTPTLLESIKNAEYLGYSYLTPELKLEKDKYQAVFALYDEERGEIGAVEKILMNPNLKNSTQAEIVNAVLGNLGEEIEEGLRPFTISRKDGALQLSRNKFYPSAVSQFRQGETAALFLQIYSPHSEFEIKPQFSLFQDENMIAELSAELVDKVEDRRTKIWNGAYILNLDDIASGEYHLEIKTQISDLDFMLKKKILLKIVP